MHGRLARLACTGCGHAADDLEHLDPERFVPCARCGHERMRPDVVWFGEIPRSLARIDEALHRCTHFAAIGTSGVVWPAAGFLDLARDLGARTWVQCLERPENLHPADRFVPGRAAERVPALIDEWLASAGA
jgi:NAD-dependent deacetylase